MKDDARVKFNETERKEFVEKMNKRKAEYELERKRKADEGLEPQNEPGQSSTDPDGVVEKEMKKALNESDRKRTGEGVEPDLGEGMQNNYVGIWGSIDQLNVEVKDAMIPEEEELALLYRNKQSFAIGHGCAARWALDENTSNAEYVASEFIPSYEAKI